MRWALLFVLVLAGSCAPEPRPRLAKAVPERPETLLRKLALDVPEDVARLPVAVTGAEMPSGVRAAPAFLATPRTIDDAERARECLTSAIYYEARSEPVEGQQAVAQVVLNRVRDRAFPPSICGVVFQGAERRTGCQFSFTCDGSMYRPRDPAAWAHAAAVAEAALAGEVYAPVGSATHFHTTAISPWWAPSLTRLATVGAHVFYRWPRAMEQALTFRQAYAGYEPTLRAGGQGMVDESDVAAAFATEQVHGVTIHRGQRAAIEPPSDEPGEPGTDASPAMVAGVRIHRGVTLSAVEGGGVRVHRAAPAAGAQPSSSPTPIEARAASASLDTTG